MTTTASYDVESNRHTFALNLIDFPPELERATVGLVDRLCGVVPVWCRTLTIKFGDCDEDDSVAQCHVNQTYRFAVITIGSYFFSSDDADRCEYLLHELLHIATATLAEPVRSMIDDLTDDLPRATQKAMRTRLIDGLEQTVQDLTFAILPLITGDDA